MVADLWRQFSDGKFIARAARAIFMNGRAALRLSQRNALWRLIKWANRAEKGSL